MRAALPRHDEILRTAIAAHDGYIVEMAGDGVHVASTDAHAAILTARDNQLALAAAELGIDRPGRGGVSTRRAGPYRRPRVCDPLVSFVGSSRY